MLKTVMFAAIATVMTLGGCATVSVIPGTAPVEQTVSIQQSALRTAASDFTEQAIERGWIKSDRGVMQFARVLAHGSDTLSGEETADRSYAALIGVGQREQSSIVMSLAADANDASSFLSALSHEALTFLTTDRANRNVTTRADLVSFERTLVQAQKARRTFVETLSELDDGDTALVDAAITKYDRQIDRARLLADRLAREYTTRNAGAVS